jgi:hypothetical protein
VDSDSARELRAKLGEGSSPVQDLNAISFEIRNSLAKCGDTFKPIDAELVGGLFVLLGDRLLSLSETERARDAYESASEVFARFGDPSLMWLAATRGEARSDLLLKNVEGALVKAHGQTEMARSWVERGDLAKGALAAALRFEAEILRANQDDAGANDLAEQARKLEER